MGFFTGLFTVGVEYDEIKDQYVISGRTGFRNIINRYGEKNINNIFTSVGRTELIFPSIFAYEVIALFKDVIRRPNNYVDAKALKKALDLLEEKVKERVSLDLDCKLDFDMIKAKMKHTPFAYQMELFNHYEGYKARTGYRGLMVAAGVGSGKMLVLDAKVKVPNGWRKIKDIKVGDLVMSVDGSYTEVLGVFPQGKRNIYNVYLEDGRKLPVCIEHLWAFYRSVDQELWEVGCTEELIKIMEDIDIYLPLHTLQPTEEHRDLDIKLHNYKATYQQDDKLVVDNIQTALEIQQVAWALGNICYIKERDSYWDIDIIEANRVKISRIENTNKEEEGICIKVAHPSELYVAEDYIVTHNTNMSLTFAELLHSEKVLIVCPLPTFEKVWLKSIVLPGNDNLYQRPEENKLWHVKSPAAYNNERFILVHYEGLENIYGILSKIAGPKTTVIVDESHNFADTKSKRTVLLQDIIDRSFTKNLFLLSGTPIKSYSTEVINMAKFIDGRLKGKLYERLYSVYANPNKFFKSILPNRYSDMTYVIEKKETKLDPIIKTYVPIKLKNGNEYTLPYIREQMRIFIEKRIKEINDAMPKYQEVYRMCIETARQNGFDKKTKYTIRQYEDLVAIIQKNYKSNNLGFIKNEMALANTIEREIKKFLPPELARQWDEVKTIIKYPLLKIQGECLGLIVMGARIKCHVDMASNLDLSALVNSTIKDTIIFSNYIQVCEAARINVTNRGYKPALVYGELSKYLNREVKAFIDNKDVNPLITTYKSLSTGVPLINANVIIALDLPFRMYIFEQAVGRAWRVGQDSQVVVYIPSLDTDNVPNINQRNLDIISFFNEEVEALTGIKSSMDIKETEALNLEAYSIAPDIRTSYFDMYLKDYDMSGYKHKLLNW